MIKIKSNLSKKGKKQVSSIIEEFRDLYNDFYITKNNLRLPIKENIDLLYTLLNKGDKIIFDEKGVLVVLGYSDKSPRKYVKILTENEKVADKLIKNLNWNILGELYCKIKKINPLKNILLRNKWKFVGDRGKEILLKREKIELVKRENNYA